MTKKKKNSSSWKTKGKQKVLWTSSSSMGMESLNTKNKFLDRPQLEYPRSNRIECGEIPSKWVLHCASPTRNIFIGRLFDLTYIKLGVVICVDESCSCRVNVRIVSTFVIPNLTRIINVSTFANLNITHLLFVLGKST